MFHNLKKKAHDIFKGGNKGLTREILPELFEEMSFNKFYSLRADDKAKLTDLCMLEVYESIVDCCGEVHSISPKAMALI